MQRLAHELNSVFKLKNNIPYDVIIGYNLYESDYDIYTNTLSERNAKKPVYSGTSSSKIEFRWTDIEGAASLTAGIIAVSAAVWSLVI